MKDIKVLGTGCASCKTTLKLIDGKGVHADATVAGVVAAGILRAGYVFNAVL